ncbi:MAG: IS200/IS605 family transposase [Verrucomicrobiaceae bacterium]
MPQSLSEVIVHFIFSTRNRAPLIDSHIRPDLHAYLATAIRENDCEAYRIGGTTDHVHLALRLSRKISQSDIVQTIKQSSSMWIKTKGPQYKNFHWQNGYGAFSVSPSHLDKLIAYIANQEEHHRTKTFKEEYLTFLKRYRITYDEKYLWD